MTFRKLRGIILVIIALGLVFSATVADIGLYKAIYVWIFSVVVMGCIIIGMKSIVEG